MKFQERLNKSKILVIGANYEPTDYAFWSKKDPNYIGISHLQDLSKSKVVFEDNLDPLNTNWNHQGFIKLLQDNLQNHKFEKIYIDRSVWFIFIEDNLFMKNVSKNIHALKSLLTNNTTPNAEFNIVMGENDNPKVNLQGIKDLMNLFIEKRILLPQNPHQMDLTKDRQDSTISLYTLQINHRMPIEEKKEYSEAEKKLFELNAQYCLFKYDNRDAWISKEETIPEDIKEYEYFQIKMAKHKDEMLKVISQLKQSAASSSSSNQNVTDEAMARKLQEEWNIQDATDEAIARTIQEEWNIQDATDEAIARILQEESEEHANLQRRGGLFNR